MILRARTEHVTRLVEELTAQRAEARIATTVEVLVEALEHGRAEGRAEHQGPEVDGSTTLTAVPASVRVGDLIRATVTGSDGVDLTATMV